MIRELPAFVAAIPITTKVTANINPLIVFIFGKHFLQISEKHLISDRKVCLKIKGIKMRLF